jgi:transposase
MSEKRVNKSYSKEFKEEAVALITEQSYNVAQAASAVGVRTNQMCAKHFVKSVQNIL